MSKPIKAGTRLPEETPIPEERDASRKFWKEPLGGTEILFCGLEIVFIPKKGSNSKTAH